MPEINFESELLILNIDPRSISKSFENNFEILKSFIALHKKYNELKHMCKDNEFIVFHNKLTSNDNNSCLFYTGLEPKIKEKYAKPGKVQNIKMLYNKCMKKYLLITW